MDTVNVSWKTLEEKGTIRKLNGGNLAPPINGEMAGRNIRKSFKDLNLAFARLHDAPLENANCPMVDVRCIFPFFHKKDFALLQYRFYGCLYSVSFNREKLLYIIAKNSNIKY